MLSARFEFEEPSRIPGRLEAGISVGSRGKLTFHHSELTWKCQDGEKECLMEQINSPLTGLLNVPRVLTGASRGSSDFLPQARELLLAGASRGLGI